MTSNDELKSILMDIQRDIKTTKSDVGQLKKEIKTLNLFELFLLIGKVDRLEKCLESLDIKERFRNILLYNVKDSPEDRKKTLQTVLNTFTEANQTMKEKHIESAIKLGKFIGNRPILVKLDNVKTKTYVFDNNQKLKSLDIGMPNDYTKTELETRKP